MPPQSLYLVIANIGKHRNVRQLVQVAAAMDARILVVGQRKNWEVPPDLSEEELVGGRWDKWHELVEYVQQHDIRLVGIEIHPNAVTVKEFVQQTMSADQQQPDDRAIALVVGNEGTGLTEKQMASCDQFVRIPQYGAGTASLNVYTAASIVLYNLRLQLMAQQQAQQPTQNDSDKNNSTQHQKLAEEGR
jgi:tRNA G18 (ribose-2'-O)-methylase SpoU